MNNTAFLVAASTVALAGLASALAKTIQEPDPFRAHRDRLLEWCNRRWFLRVEFLLGALLLLPVPMAAQAAAALVLALIVLGSEIRQAQHPEEEPEGFGSLSPRSKAVCLAIGAGVALAALLVAIDSLQAPRAVVAPDVRVSAIAAVLLLAIGLKLLRDQKRGQGYAQKPPRAAAPEQLPADLALGGDERGSVYGRDLATLGRSALIVGLGAECSDSADVHALLSRHADLLARDLLVIAIAPQARVYGDRHGPALRRLVDEGSHLARYFGIHARPYAMLVGADSSLLAPPSLTPQKVQRLITLLVTTVQNAPTSLLTLVPDARPAAAQPSAAETH